MLDISSNKGDSKNTDSESLITESEIVGINQTDKGKIIQVFTLAILAIFLLMTILVFALNSSRQTTLKNKISNYDDLNNQFKSNKELTATDQLAQQFESGLSKISSFISKKTSWSIFFTELQKITPADISYTNLSVNEKTLAANLSGEGSGFNSVSLLLASLRESDKISSPKLISTSLASGTSSNTIFNIEFKVEDTKLIPSNK